MTATQLDSDREMTRRGVMRRTAIGIGAAASLGAVGSAPAAAADIDWNTLGKYAATALIGGPAAVGIAAYGSVFSGPDDSQVSDAISWESHVQEYTRAREDNLTLNQTIASLRRDVQLVPNKAREEAIFRIYEQGVDSGSEADATAAAETAINEAYATVERSIYQMWHIRANRYLSFARSVSSDTYESYHHQLEYYGADESYGNPNGDTDSRGMYYVLENNSREITLLNGELTTYLGGTNYDTASTNVAAEPDPRPMDGTHMLESKTRSNVIAGGAVTYPDHTQYSSVDSDPGLDGEYGLIVSVLPWYNTLRDLYTGHEQMMNEVSSMVDTYYQPAVDGEIDLTNALGPAHLTDTAKNATDYQEATMALRGMGFSISDQTVEVTFKSDGDTYNLVGRLARTVQDPNPLTVGTELQPSQIVGTIYGAFNIVDENGDRTGETFEITKPFTIETAEGSDSVTFSQRTIVEPDKTYTSEEINQIFKENYEANQEATETVYDTALDDGGGGGGGGGGDLGSDQNWGIIALGAGAAAIGWGYITGDDQ